MQTRNWILSKGRKDQALQSLFYSFYDQKSRIAIFSNQKLCFLSSCGMNWRGWA